MKCSNMDGPMKEYGRAPRDHLLPWPGPACHGQLLLSGFARSGLSLSDKLETVSLSETAERGFQTQVAAFRAAGGTSLLFHVQF